MLDKLEEFLKTKSGKITLLILGLLIIVGVVVGIILSINQSGFTEASTKIDDPSGLDVYDSNAEPEGESEVVVIGLNILYDFGFSASQQDKIYTTIKDFITDELPSAATISYEKNSFKYTSEEEVTKSEFKIISDTKVEFLVSLDTDWSYEDIDVKITKL
ncbi:hypothetical protein IKW75_03225 [Candidatus Saccharibacteria bacterium]|nr:hypothetical protein [Candidatus Saccharibacteria bacterium]